MNTESGEKLKFAAERGDIELLYEVIRHDPSILEIIDKNQFEETPLHISLSRGYLKFATEIMNLKPSFAIKLNMQGYSPIHLAIKSLVDLVMNNTIRLATDSPIHHAMDNTINLAMDSPIDYAMDSRIVHQRAMVSYLVGINKDLVRVKGREGLTPLHFACLNGEVELLAKFLTSCPDSIEDVTASGESALHIAVNSNQFHALQVLVGWLKANCQRGARKLERKIINKKDITGNTVLHFAAQNREQKFVRFLVKTSRIKLDAKNLQMETALDVARTPEIKKILTDAKAKHGSDISKAPTHAEELTSKNTIVDNVITWIRRVRRDISDEQRNTWLIVATIVATATYESALNPPGGIFQVSASDDKNLKIKSIDSYYSTRGNAGKSILSRDTFLVFSLANMLSFAVSTIVMIILTPSEALGRLLFTTVVSFVGCYLIALHAISPTHANTTILYFPIYSIEFIVCIVFVLLSYYDFKQANKLRRSQLRSYHGVCG